MSPQFLLSNQTGLRMSTHEQPTNPEPTPQPDAGPVVASPDSAVTGATWVLVIVAAIVAGAGSLVVLEGLFKAYQKAFEPIPAAAALSAEELVNIARAHVESETLAFGATGGLLGLMLGLAGGISRKSSKSAILAGTVGLLIGGIVETGAARLGLLLIYNKFDPRTDEILRSLLGHLGLWGGIGLTGGLAFGLGLGGRGRWWRAAIGGLVGASLATVAYEILGAIAFATGGAQEPVAAKFEPRALAQFLIPLGTAIGAILLASDQTRKQKQGSKPSSPQAEA
jgi:hypothetical protein